MTNSTDLNTTLNTIPIDAGLSLPDMGENHPIQRMLNSALKKQLGARQSLNVPMPTWPAQYFTLHQADGFCAANEAQQAAIVARCSLGILEEALYIEKCGMAYGVKMSALSNTVEERMFYNLMASEEAIHYHQIRQFIPNHRESTTPSLFHQRLAEMIELDDRDSLRFFVQVVLEGWGLSHYKSLAEHCECPLFAKELFEILKDEARHHGSGVIFSKATTFSAETIECTVHNMGQLLELVQLGSQGTLAAVNEVLGPMSRDQQLTLLTQLNSEAESAKKLQLLRHLMLNNGGEAVVSQLDKMNRFTPYAVEQCV